MGTCLSHTLRHPKKGWPGNTGTGAVNSYNDIARLSNYLIDSKNREGNKTMQQSYKRRRAGAALAMLLFTSLPLSGCGKNTIDNTAQISIPIYDKIEYNTTRAMKGDIEPEISLTLRVDGFRNISYSVDREDLELDKVHVKVGDRVKKGDVLVSFQSGDIEDMMKEYQQQLEEDALLIRHYKKLMKIEETASRKQKKKAEVSEYRSMLDDIEREMYLIRIRIEEASEKLKGFSLIAEADGSIASVEEGLYFGYVTPDVTLVSETCGSKDYVAVTKDDYNFSVGSVYVAESGVASYDMRLKAIEAGENEGERRLQFEPVTDMSGVSKTDSFTIYVKKPVIKDVVYIPTRAVCNVDDKYYVYVMDENGFREGVEVTVGETVGEPGSELTVITSGLSGGEQVMLR